MNQTTVSLARVDGSRMKAMYCRPNSIAAPVPAVLVIFDFLGMTADLSRIAARFVDNGYAVMVPDLYDRKERRILCVLRAVRAAGRGSGREYDDLRLAREYLGAQKEVDSTRIAVTGFCMGGGFAIYLGTTGLYKVSAPYLWRGASGQGKAAWHLSGDSQLWRTRCKGEVGGRSSTAVASHAARCASRAEALSRCGPQLHESQHRLSGRKGNAASVDARRIPRGIGGGCLATAVLVLCYSYESCALTRRAPRHSSPRTSAGPT